jgi:hypothetical protein
MRFLGVLLALVSVLTFTVTAPVSAGTISVTQTITVTARVLPKRSIVVNDKGQMTKIYSNTTENVTPKVYLNDVPGEARSLTPELLQQYYQVIGNQKHLAGVAIPVEPPRATNTTSVKNIFIKNISSLTRSLSL